MLRLTIIFCLFSVISFSQDSTFVWLNNVMAHQGYMCIDYYGKVRFKLKGEEVFSLKGDDQSTNFSALYLPTYNFSKGPFPIITNGNSYLININGDRVIDFGDKYAKIYAPSCGIMCAKLHKNEDSTQRYVYLDARGKEMFKHQIFYTATAFRDDISIVQFHKKGPWNIINKKGETISRLNNTYRKSITKIHSISEGRIVTTVRKYKLFNKSVYEDLVVVFDYTGNVVFTTKYNIAKSKDLNIIYKSGILKIRSKETNKYIDLDGNLIKSFPSQMQLTSRTKDYFLISGKNRTKVLYDLNLNEVRIPSNGNEFETHLSCITDFGISVYYKHLTDSNLSFTQIYDPITFKKTYQNPGNLTTIHFPQGRITKSKSFSNVGKIYDLNQNKLYESAIEDMVYKSMGEALKNPTEVQYLMINYAKDLAGLGKLINLKGLSFYKSDLLDLPNIENLKNLNYLGFHYCKNLTSLPEGINSTKLTTLHVSGSHNIKLKTIIPDLKYLKKVYHSHYVVIDNDYRELIKFLKLDVEFISCKGLNHERVQLK